MNSPVAVFAYNKLLLLRQTIEDLRDNYGAKKTDLVVFIDGPKTKKESITTKRIVNYVSLVEGFRSVQYYLHTHNLGLKGSILFGVNYMLERHDMIIVLEDDLKTSPYFLNYMNDALELYKDESQVCQISGYSYLEKYLSGSSTDSTYFLMGGDCLAWATWKRAWKIYSDDSSALYKTLVLQDSLKDFDRNGSFPFSKALRKNVKSQKSWAINWLASTYLLDMLTLYPVKSLARHIVDEYEPGTNYKKIIIDPLNVTISDRRILIRRIEIRARSEIEKSYQRFLKQYSEGPWKTLIRYLKTVFKFLYGKVH